MAEQSNIELNKEIIELRLENERLRNMCLVMEQMSVLLMPIISECKCHNNYNSDKIKTKLNVLKLKYEHLKNDKSLHNSSNNSFVDKIRNCDKSTEKIVIKKLTEENEDFYESIDENNSNLNNEQTNDISKKYSNRELAKNKSIESDIDIDQNNCSEIVDFIKEANIDQIEANVRKKCLNNRKPISDTSKNLDTRSKSNKRRDKKQLCPWVGCGLSFRDAIDMKNHMWRHTGQKANRCDWIGCGKQFTTSSYLRKHQRLTHLNQKSETDNDNENGDNISKNKVKPEKRLIQCDWPGCEKYYTNRSNVLKHMKKKHLEKRIYKCQFLACDQAFVDKRQLLVHKVNAHNLSKPNRCDWPGCEFSSCYPQKLAVHKLRHTGSKEFKCLWPECEWSFRQNSHLKTHMLKHTGEKPFDCEEPDCDRKFQTKQAMKIHLTRFHKIYS